MTTTPKATLKRRRLFGHLMLKTSFSLKKKIQLFISLHSYFPRIYIKILWERCCVNFYPFVTLLVGLRWAGAGRLTNCLPDSLCCCANRKPVSAVLLTE